VSVTDHGEDHFVPNRPSIVCKRMVVLQDIDIDVNSADDDYDDELVVGSTSHHANTPLAYEFMHASCRPWKDKATMTKKELEDGKKEHDKHVKELLDTKG
jgi:hypothetical protein